MFRLQLQNGKLVGPVFKRYQDAFNYRVQYNLVGARVIEQ